MVDLLDEIEYNPDFGAPKSSNNKDQLDQMQLQIEAILLMLRVCGFSEDLYQVALAHIMDDIHTVAKNKVLADVAFFEESNLRFAEKVKRLHLQPTFEGQL